MNFEKMAANKEVGKAGIWREKFIIILTFLGWHLKEKGREMINIEIKFLGEQVKLLCRILLIKSLLVINQGVGYKTK